MTDTVSSPPIAVLGTGLIGSALARNLASKGFEVHVWNRSADKARALEAAGIKAFSDLAEAVQGAIILTVLKDGKAVKETIEAALPGIAKGAVWLQLSTVGVDAIYQLSRFAAEHRIVFYDAPIQGTRQPAEKGKLTILAAGPEHERGTAQRVFDAIGQRTMWISEVPGSASRLKLALNAFVFALTHGTAETLAIAKQLGIDPSLVVEAVTGGPLDSGYFQAKAATMLKGDFTPSFSVENGIKDTELVLKALAGSQVRADLVVAGLDRFERARSAGNGDKDIAASFLADA